MRALDPVRPEAFGSSLDNPITKTVTFKLTALFSVAICGDDHSKYGPYKKKTLINEQKKIHNYS